MKMDRHVNAMMDTMPMAQAAYLAQIVSANCVVLKTRAIHGRRTLSNQMDHVYVMRATTWMMTKISVMSAPVFAQSVMEILA
jgi:hypothetical protein